MNSKNEGFNLPYEIGKLMGKVEILEEKVKHQEQIQAKTLEYIQTLCKTIDNLSNGIATLGDYCDKLNERLESRDA
jgi:hypothetical protein|nr:MAG TPA: hypothetical protein [Caudoviricetes sp.]